MKEKEKMILGLPYNPVDIQLVYQRDRAARILHRYNHRVFHEVDMKNRLLKNLIKPAGRFWIKPPFACDYGYNIELGESVMINFGCVLLDVCRIAIGDHTLIGPHTQIYTACHAVDPTQRLAGIEFGKEVHVGRNVWIGGNVTILPGVTIGDHSVIGAGSVVTKDIPAYCVAVGNPCVIKRELERVN